MPFSSPGIRALWNSLALTSTALATVGTVFAVGPSGPAADAAPGSGAASAVASGADAAGPAAGSAAAGSAAAAAGSASGPAVSSAGSASSAAGSAAGHSAAAAAGSRSSSAAASPAAGSAPASGGGGLMYIGSVAGGYQQAVAATGVPLANHAYAFFTSNVPQAAMITVSAADTKWRDVAAAGPGSALYDQIVRWAQTIKARGGSVMVAYNHEPEGHDRLTLGSASDFIAAYRHVVSIFDQQGASNVVWTWQMTAYAFRVGSGSDQAAARWYPGDDVVDNVGADAYNWISCGATGTGTYNEMSALGDPVLAFARAHGKAASFPEFASHANANRVQWLNNAQQYFVQNQDVLTAAFYFNRPPTVAENSDCRWGLTTSSEYGALRQMAQDTAHFRV